MCGIVGFISKKKLNNSKSVLLGMISELNHRGPDDSGSKIWNDENFTVGFGHTRLSILDLSNNQMIQ
jgi:asparagine synthase (glutamine-hydrolysing)